MLNYLDICFIILLLMGVLVTYSYIRLSHYEYHVIFTYREEQHIKRLEKYVFVGWFVITVVGLFVVTYLAYLYYGIPKYGMPKP